MWLWVTGVSDVIAASLANELTLSLVPYVV